MSLSIVLKEVAALNIILAITSGRLARNHNLENKLDLESHGNTGNI